MYPRQQVALAYAMKREKVARLQAEIRLHQELLLAAQSELNELQWLQGQKLTARMMWESPADVFQEKREWKEELEDIFIEAA